MQSLWVPGGCLDACDQYFLMYEDMAVQNAMKAVLQNLAFRRRDLNMFLGHTDSLRKILGSPHDACLKNSMQSEHVLCPRTAISRRLPDFRLTRLAIRGIRHLEDDTMKAAVSNMLQVISIRRGLGDTAGVCPGNR